MNRFPDLPMICDPSHISGNRNLIFDVSQTALDLNYDGLMIETHCNPANCLYIVKYNLCLMIK